MKCFNYLNRFSELLCSCSDYRSLRKIEQEIVTLFAVVIIGLSGTIINNGFAAGRASYDGPADEDVILDYCITHADRVEIGENVVQDPIDSGLVSEYTLTGKTCEGVKDMQSTAHFMSCNNVMAVINNRPLDPDCG